MNFTVSENLYLSHNGEWIRVDENLVSIGLTDFRLSWLGEVLFLDLPDIGKLVHKGESLFSIESVKFTHDFVSPVSGTLIEVNESLFTDPGILNDDPFNGGWIIVVEMNDEKDLATLVRASECRNQNGMDSLVHQLDQEIEVLDA
ncbi:MAG: glycine cleavage system protein H [Bdellovibrionales bacterium CG10_big_fil_rev_8_21_14_0_10_45_34]|nr:MAG: glycine cleavage system protein H [Bdellovibrionales bacterium CG10_big_fil_rev_8_21_14_0_10_45_34]